MPQLAAAAAAEAPEVRAAAAAAPDTIDHARPNGRFSDWVKAAEAWPNPFSANTLEEDKPFKHMPKKCRHAQCHLMQMYTEFGTRDLCEPCYKTMHGGSYTPSSDVAQTRKCDACYIPDRELVRRLFKGAPPNTFLTFDYVHVFPKPYDTYPWLCQPGVSAAAFIANLQADTVARPQTMQQRIHQPIQPQAASSSSSQPPPQPPQALPPAPQSQAPVLPHSQQLPGLIGPQPLTWRGKSGRKSRGHGRPY